jgi:hypothetical protein
MPYSDGFGGGIAGSHDDGRALGEARLLLCPGDDCPGDFAGPGQLGQALRLDSAWLPPRLAGS